jgi:NADPH-dependent glutamate synthase beta subunit-like oxidoreductase
MPPHDSSRHVVAVVGAATAGSEIARVLSDRGATVVLFEQNPRPYGKIEDGLPRWHVKQRKEEYEEINQRLERPLVHYVPDTRLGRDLDFEDLRTRWGLSAIVLTHGAWRDRPLAIEGADEFVNRGLIYQNSFIYWFNHYVEKAYQGPRYEIIPGTIVVGGGLASIDVVKVIQIEMTLRALAARGITEDMVRIEREGVDAVLASHNLNWVALGLKPAKLFYRRRVLDMPLSDIPVDAPPRRAEALRSARAKILEKAMRKFQFEFRELRSPAGLVIEDGRMTGVRFSPTEVVDGQVRVVAGEPEIARSAMTISSIGSIPEPIAGIPQRGETYTYADQKSGLLMDGPTAVFAAGNVLTGKGNIKDSLENGTEVALRVAESYLGLSDEPAKIADGARAAADAQGNAIAGAMDHRPKLAGEAVEAILRRVRDRQNAVGYHGDYRAWLSHVMPPDLQ